MRVNGDPDGAKNGLFYLYSDHLGSTSAIQRPDGTVEQARYLPFGGWRTEPGNLPTNRGYTGHVMNNMGSGADDLGLIYMNARFYVPGIGRFASADTIVPNPTNPQSLNRYSYTRNSPLNLIDSTGHREIDIDNGGGGGYEVRMPILSRDEAQQALKSLGNGAVTTASVLPVVGDVVDVYDFGSAMVQGDWVQAGVTAGLALAPGSARVLRGVGGEVVEGVVRNLDETDGFIRVVPMDQIGTSQPFKLRSGEDGISVFEGVFPDEVLAELPGNRTPNTTVIIPRNGLPAGTNVVSTEAPELSQKLSDAHRILVRPEGWSNNRFAQALKSLVGWD